MMQMVFYDGYPKLQIGYRLTVIGTLEHATTGHHNAEVLIQVKSFQ